MLQLTIQMPLTNYHSESFSELFDPDCCAAKLVLRIAPGEFRMGNVSPPSKYMDDHLYGPNALEALFCPTGVGRPQQEDLTELTAALR
jgi:hypothetical protein